MLNRSLALAVMLSPIIMACAPAAYDGRLNYDPSLITFAEIEAFERETALEMLKKVRPSFLFPRGATGPFGPSRALPTVYVDGIRYGSFSSLAEIPASRIAEIRMYRSGSSVHFGTGNGGGVLAIRTRDRR